LKEKQTSFFHTLSNWFFINHSTIGHYITQSVQIASLRKLIFIQSINQSMNPLDFQEQKHLMILMTEIVNKIRAV
jgi:hypothetical protein